MDRPKNRMESQYYARMHADLHCQECGSVLSVMAGGKQVACLKSGCRLRGKAFERPEIKVALRPA